jgi:hypothetical protein
VPDPGIHAVRFVVQHSQRDGKGLYRVLAYSDERNYRPAEFKTEAALQDALQAALPKLAHVILAGIRETADTYIVFSGSADLTESQLQTLGLK